MNGKSDANMEYKMANCETFGDFAIFPNYCKLCVVARR